MTAFDHPPRRTPSLATTMRVTPLLALSLASIAAVTSAAHAQAGATNTVFNAWNRESQARIPRLDRADTVHIDGNLDEPQWSEAALLTGFSLYQPQDGLPAPDSTEALVWYDADALYVGIRAFEPHGGVRATLADRDRISSDDNIELQLDTYHDLRRAFVFIVNPLGVQADGTKNEGGGFIPGSNVAPGQTDLSADFVWQSKGEVTPWGYQVEMRIPFSSLRYPERAPQTWGIQLERHVQHSGYDETWTRVVRASASYIAQEGALVGLAGMHHGQTLDVNPELTTTANGYASAEDSVWRYHNAPSLGGNVRWGIGSNFVLNGTVRPDFSQVEADALQIATDPRFALFYPEKRPFFVEGADQFNVPNTLVYTRTIVRPEGAAKLTGNLPGLEVATLVAGDDRSTSASGVHPFVGLSNFKHSFGAQNTAEVMLSDREDGGAYNRVADADVHIVWKRIYFWQFQAVGATTRRPDSTRAVNAPMWEAVLDRTGRAFGFHYNVLGIGNGFQAWNGFVPRTGIVQPNVANRFTLYGAPGSFIEAWNGFHQIVGVWRYNDFFSGRQVLEERSSFRNSFTLHGGWGVSITPAVNHYRFDPASYASWRVVRGVGDTVAFTPSSGIGTASLGIAVATPQFQRFAASASLGTGSDVEFTETTLARRVDASADLEWRPTERVRVSATYLQSTVRRDYDRSVALRTRIPRLRAEYQLTRSVFVRLVGQYAATTQAQAIDASSGFPLTGTGTCESSGGCKSNDFRSDVLFSYRPSPGTVFFAGYGSDLTEPDALAFQSLRRTDDAFFVKASYVFR